VGELIETHPKFVNLWANRYIKLYRTQGREVAVHWANTFLPIGPRTHMVEKVKEITSKNKA